MSPILANIEFINVYFFSLYFSVRKVILNISFDRHPVFSIHAQNKRSVIET